MKTDKSAFVGRESEQKAINYLLSRTGYRGAILYGRRRLGKTALLRHCLLNKGVPCVFYQCDQESERSNTDGLTKTIEESLGLSNLHFNKFIDAVSFVFKKSVEREIYFAIDEYPYIRKILPAFDSKLQSVIDEYKDKASLAFFLCGSSISIMEALLMEDNPLYRRFSLPLLLKEMDYFESSAFYSSFSNDDKVRLFAAFGGSPFYNAQIDERLSVKENIIRLLTGPFASISDDIVVNLKSEMSKINNANAVFSAIAAKKAFHYSDVLAKSHVASSSILSDVLEKLEKADLINHISPINQPKNKQTSGYIIKDNALRFFYHYIFQNGSARSILDENVFYDRYVNQDFESEYVPKVFETIVKQYLTRRNKRGENDPLFTDIGTYWYDNPREKKNGQFDVVAKCDDGYLFFEAKFTSKPITDDVIEREIEQVNATNLKPIKYGFASRSGFALAKPSSYILFDLNDIYNG